MSLLFYFTSAWQEQLQLAFSERIPVPETATATLALSTLAIETVIDLQGATGLHLQLSHVKHHLPHLCHLLLHLLDLKVLGLQYTL